MFPNISGEVLTFSSDGYPGMGGLDIFKTNITSLDNAENVGAPFNSHRDDFGLITRDDMKTGYYCSNRNDSNGLDHIYRFEKNALSNTLNGETTNIITGTDGRFSFDVMSDQAYKLTGSRREFIL